MQLEAYSSGDSQEIIFKPSDGDVRCNMAGAIERYENSGWMYIGDIDLLFRNVNQLEMDRTELMAHMWDQQRKDQEEIIADELEDKDDALKEVGTYLRELEKMLRVARKSYNSMLAETQAKFKTFERLDTPYPDGEIIDPPF